MAGHGKGVLRIAIEDFIETFDLGKVLWNWNKFIWDKLEDELLDMYENMFSKFEYREFMPLPFTPAAIKGLPKKQPVHIAAILMGLVMMAIGLVVGMLAPLQRLGTYQIDKRVHSNRPSPLELLAMSRRIGYDITKADTILDELGFTEEIKHGYYELARQYLPALEYINAYRRNEMSIETVIDNLYKQGLSREDAQMFVKISEVIPNIGDLIRMAVREAFSPEIVSRFQYGEAFPDEVLQYTRKQGLSDDWVKRYWYAHWELPSPQQGYEMLHRLRPNRTDIPFTPNDLDLLLRTADYAPKFREWLKAISYNPITRVDVRRMYKLGIFDAGEVKERYMDIGYKEADAQALADFTVKYENADGGDKREKYKDLSFSTLKSLYIKDVITLDEFHGKLLGLGYDEEETRLIIELADLDNQDDVSIDFHKKFVSDMIGDISAALANRMITQDAAKQALTALGVSDINIGYILEKQEYDASLGDLNDNIKFIRDSYISGSMDRNTLVGELGKLGISGNQQNKLIDDLELALKYRNRRLTEAQYRNAWLSDIITLDDYKTNLVGLGYTDYDIDILVKLYTPVEGE